MKHAHHTISHLPLSISSKYYLIWPHKYQAVIMRVVFYAFILFLSFGTNAQSYAGSEGKKDVVQMKGASCTPPSTTTMLEMNNVKAMIHTAGNLWQVPGQNLSQYEVPKNSGIMALFTSALWLGGVDINGQLKLAALRYRNGQDYWTGPLTQGAAEITYQTCYDYDKHYVTTQVESLIPGFRSASMMQQMEHRCSPNCFRDIQSLL